MARSARSTTAFASAIFRTPIVLALLYSVHGGEAHTKSKCPGGYVVGSQSSMSLLISAAMSRSSDVTSHPRSTTTATTSNSY